MAIVYLVTNTQNGKRYIGKTKWTASKRWARHVYDASIDSAYALHRAIRKYGADAFTIEVVAEYETETEALKAEMFWVERHETIGALGYNMCRGGRGTLGYRHPPEMRQRLSELAISKGQRPSPEALRRSAALRANGLPEAMKANMVTAQRARRAREPVTDEFREKCRRASIAGLAKRTTPRAVTTDESARRAASTARTADQRISTWLANLEPNDLPRISLGEAARRLGRTTTTLQVWDNNGLLPARRSPRGVRYYDLAEFEAAIKTLTVPRTGRKPRAQAK